MNSDRLIQIVAVGVLAMIFSGPELRSFTTRSSGRMITSSFRPFGNSTGAVLLAGRFSCRIFVLENTAVKIRKNTKITIMSIIGTMLRSSRP